MQAEEEQTLKHNPSVYGKIMKMKINKPSKKV